MRSSTAVGLAAARGRFTSIPRYIIGAVSMKISRRTRTTSTSGMMLIAARLVPMRRVPPGGPTLNAIFRGPRELGRGAAQDVEHVEREPLHLRRPVLDAIDEVVVADDGRDGGAEPGRRRHERLRDSGRDHREAGRTLRADPVEGVHDAHHGTEEADERAGARRRREERQVPLQLGDVETRRAAHGAVGRLEPVGARLLALVHEVLQVVAARQLLVRGEVELRERTLAELLGRDRHDAGPPTLTKDLEEAKGLAPYATELPPLFDDQRPADDREDREHREDGLRDRARAQDELEDAAGQRIGRGRHARSLGSFDDTDRATGCQHFRPKKSGFSLTSRMRHPYNRLVVRAVPAMVILAALLSVAAASGSDARTAVDAFVARLGEVNVADLVIEQTLTLFDPGGRHPQSSGEQRVYIKLPRRQRVEQTIDGQKAVRLTVGDRVWVRAPDGKTFEAPPPGTRDSTHLLVPFRRTGADLLAEWKALGVRDDVSYGTRFGDRTAPPSSLSLRSRRRAVGRRGGRRLRFSRLAPSILAAAREPPLHRPRGGPARGIRAGARPRRLRGHGRHRDQRVLRAAEVSPPRRGHACRARPVRALSRTVGGGGDHVEPRAALLARRDPARGRRRCRRASPPPRRPHVRRLALCHHASARPCARRQPPRPTETLGWPAIQKRRGRSLERVMPTRGPRAIAKSRGRPGGRITRGPRVRSAPLSRSDSPSACVRLPGPLASRRAATLTPRRRAIVVTPSSGSSARMSTQPGRPAGLAIAFRQWWRP